jgi:hypothetical protein
LLLDANEDFAVVRELDGIADEVDENLTNPPGSPSGASGTSGSNFEH